MRSLTAGFVGGVIAVAAFGIAHFRTETVAAPRQINAAASNRDLVSLMGGRVTNAAAATIRPASETSVCINFQNGDDPAVNSGELWELRHLNCSGPDCLIVMMRPNFDHFIEDHLNLPSSGVATFDPPGDGTWTFSWQTMWTRTTGEGGLPLTNGFSAYTCRLGKSFPNYYGFAAIGRVVGGAAGAYPFHLTSAGNEWCHLDYCSTFNKLPSAP
jgi:hypothetical protein